MIKFNLKDLGDHYFIPHPTRKKLLIFQLFFDNGYGISVITKYSKSPFNEYMNFYDIAILKGVSNNNSIVVLPEMKYVDPDYDNYEAHDGVWKDLDFDKIYHKAKIISLL